MEDEQNHLPPPVMSESFERMKESLEHAIHVLSGILNDVNSGNYTKEQATLDAENLMMTEGLDFISSILDYSESED